MVLKGKFKKPKAPGLETGLTPEHPEPGAADGRTRHPRTCLLVVMATSQWLTLLVPGHLVQTGDARHTEAPQFPRASWASL